MAAAQKVQRTACGPDQRPPDEPLLSLRHARYGLPTKLVENFESLGVRAIYPWQLSCLLGKGFLDGSKNLIYTAPIGGGKSLVADVLMLKRFIDEPGKKPVLVLPYAALVHEKLKWLRALADRISNRVDEVMNQAEVHPFSRIISHIQVMGFLGGSRAKITWFDFDIAVCTIRKANALVNSVIEDGKIDQPGVAIFDELHMLDGECRGYVMELMATKPNFFRTASKLSGRIPAATQKPAEPTKRISTSDHQDLSNPLLNAVVASAVETAVDGFGALFFVGSMIEVERVASLINENVLASLRALPTEYESTFNKTILCGVGFHHAGITLEEREIVIDAYDRGVSKVVVATRSLAAGINLPPRRVILHVARMGRDLVGPAMLRQMRCRAACKGKDEVGKTYLSCAKQDLEAAAELLEAEMPPVASCLTPEKRGLKRAILEVVETKLANSHGTLEQCVRSSLLWQTHDHHFFLSMLNTAIIDLVKRELIKQPSPVHVSYEPKQLGSAIVASAITPEDGISVHAEM